MVDKLMAEAEKHTLDERTQTYLDFIGAIAEMSSIGQQKFDDNFAELSTKIKLLEEDNSVIENERIEQRNDNLTLADELEKKQNEQERTAEELEEKQEQLDNIEM